MVTTIVPVRPALVHPTHMWQRIKNVESHVSPDGRLRFLVVADPDGDLALGFDGFPWHTHADIVASLSGLEQAQAVRCYVDDLLYDRSVIAL